MYTLTLNEMQLLPDWRSVTLKSGISVVLIPIQNYKQPYIYISNILIYHIYRSHNRQCHRHYMYRRCSHLRREYWCHQLHIQCLGMYRLKLNKMQLLTGGRSVTSKACISFVLISIQNYKQPYAYISNIFIYHIYRSHRLHCHRHNRYRRCSHLRRE